MQNTNAIQTLKTIARSQLEPLVADLPTAQNLRAALANHFAIEPSTPTTESDLAEATLNLLAEDPKFTEPIRQLTSQASYQSTQKYIDPATIALTTAVLLALQTRLKFKRETDGTWSIEIDKKSAGDATIKLVVQRLLSFLDK